MSAPDFRRGFLRVPNALWQALFCRTPLTRRQLQLIAVVLRESWGWTDSEGEVRLWTRPLSTGAFAQVTGLSTDRIRRDLDALVVHGVLRESAGRFQLVAEPRQWKALGTAPKPRELRAEAAVSGVKAAPQPSGSKTGKKEQRNATLRSPAPAASGSVLPQLLAAPSPDTPTSGSRPQYADRLVRVIQTFIGPLSSSERQKLRAWARIAGIAAVWTAISPALCRNPDAARDALSKALRERKEGDGPTGAA